ncbi:MAG: hypothetical protein Q8O38_16955 [Sulfurimicrobium sp.]|nr:hypothetical protein [Sulfurimicrobium sp.]
MEILEILTEQVLVFDGGESILVLDDGRIEALDVAEQGPPGPQGIPGPTGGSALQYLAGIALGGHRMVVLDDAGLAIYADKSIPAHAGKVLGMTTGAANPGELATIQTGGEMTEPSWSWLLNQPIYLGANGLLTQTPPVTGISLIVGFPITATKVFISIKQLIFLI